MSVIVPDQPPRPRSGRAILPFALHGAPSPAERERAGGEGSAKGTVPSHEPSPQPLSRSAGEGLLAGVRAENVGRQQLPSGHVRDDAER